ncbi:hypothetical protein PVIIG_05888 [Plasmodium vivax India VII]|uniref:Variable surface protein n=1 Tax=Plasmodium vivax India VII TaxID=1077284 RepID=A0A0J9S204_PLAVI|nr:hypothetical protein PVIIG_05888 [Plasmodium vivax India VII]
MAKHLTKKNLNDFTSKVMYYNFEYEIGDCQNVPFHSDVVDDLNMNPKLKHISQKLVKALCFIYNRKKYHQDNFNNELCSYLYYWIGDKLYANLSTTRDFSKNINMMYEELNKYNQYIICNPLSTSVDKKTFDRNNILYDFSKDYLNIKIDTAHGETTCDTDYKEYILKYISTYNDAYSNCKGNNQEEYDCDHFNRLFKEHKYQDLSSFSCRYRQNDGETLETQTANRVQEPASELDVRSSRYRASDGYNFKAENTNFGMHNTRHVHNKLERIEPISSDNTTESGTSKTIAGSVAPVLGVSSISLLLYKVIENIIDIHTFIIYICFLFFKYKNI